MESRRQLQGLFMVNFAVTLGFGISDAFFSAYLFSLGARGLLLGIPLLLYSLSKVLLTPVLGAWSDRVGCRRLILLSLGLYLAVSLGYLYSSDLATLTVLRLVQGVSCAMFRPVLQSLVGRLAGDKERATVLATFDLSFYGALGFGPVLGGVVKDISGYDGVFAAVTVSCLAALALASRALPAVIPPEPAVDGHPLRWIGTTGRRGYRGLLAFIFGRACGISLSAAFLPILLTAKLGLNGTRSGVILASGTAMMTLLLRPSGKLSDLAPRRPLVIAGGAAVSLLYFLVPEAGGFGQMLCLTLGIGCFSVLSQPACSALLVEEGARYGMGATVGLFQSVLNLGFVVGPLLGAMLHEALGLTAVFHAAGAVGLAAVSLFAIDAFAGAEESRAANDYSPLPMQSRRM